MKYIVLICSFSFFLSSLNSQKWDTIIGSPDIDEGFQDIIEFYDKGYLVSGGNFEILQRNWLVKTDINKNVLWEKFVAWDNNYVVGSNIDQDSNGNSILASAVNGPGVAGLWPWISKINPCGEIEWCRVFPNESYDYGWYDDVLVLDNNDIITLVQFISEENNDRLFIDYIDKDGNFQWRHGYALQENHPHIRSCSGDGIRKYGDNYIIHGHCYYPYPDDTTHFFQRPLYIMLDSLFNEQWILPFGVNDYIVGESYHSISLNDSVIIGVGVRRMDGDVRNSLLMFFNMDGEEVGYQQITNNEITPGLNSNLIQDIVRIDESLFLTSSYFRYVDEPGQWGEMVIDALGNIYQYEMRDQNTTGWSTMVKTYDNKYTIGCSWDEGNGVSDIYLYKINENLEHDTVYTGNYIYDSLCPYQIESGEIDISDCITVSVGEVPTLEDYNTNLRKIRIKAYPNPVNGNEVTFELQNTQHLENMELKIFNVFGKQVHKEKVYKYQGEAKIDISNWQSGIYFTIVYAEGMPVGECKFVVR
jgi:hypothetical protein